jgi:capsular polysaccharide biosynthesis protein
MDMTKEKENEIRFADLWSVFKRCWILALILAVLAGAGSFAVFHLTHTDAYTATSTIWALGSNANASTSGGKTSTSDVSIGTYLINDYKELILTDSVLEEAIVKVGSDMSLKDLKQNVKVTNNAETRVMYVAVTAGDKTEAKELANAISDVFCARINDKSDEGKTLVSVWDHAKEPTAISNPVSLLLVVLIALVAAIGVYAVFLVLHLMDDKIHDAGDVERYLGVNLLGVIPNREDACRRGLKKNSYYRYGATK